MDPLVIEQKIEQFLEIIKAEPQLPRKIDKILLLRYLKATDFDLDRAKKLLMSGLKWRQKRPDIFTERDPMSKDMRSVIAIA